MAEKDVLGMSLSISQDYIEKLTKDMLTQSLIETLDAKNEITRQIVSSVLSVKVDENGRPSSYNSDRNRTFLHYLCEKMIREEAVSAAEEVLNERRSDVRDAIKKEISKKASIDKLLSVFFNSVVDNMNNKFRTNFNLSVEPYKEG